MDVFDIIGRLEKSEEFSAWSKAHSDAYLAHIFCMVEKNEKSWQIGYVDKELVIVFEMGEKIKQLPADKPFVKPGKFVPKLDQSTIKLDVNDALGKASALQQEKYPADKPCKIIIILQNVGQRTIYNITYVTQSFKTLNIRVAADNGEIVSDKLVSFFESWRLVCYRVFVRFRIIDFLCWES